MSAMAGYLDAVSDALTAAGIGVRGAAADAARQMLAVDLDALPDGRMPVMVWTPSAGWRVAVGAGGRLLPGTIRYVHAGPVPSPAYVAESLGRWLADPRALTDVEPVYDRSPRELDRALVEAAGGAR